MLTLSREPFAGLELEPPVGLKMFRVPTTSSVAFTISHFDKEFCAYTFPMRLQHLRFKGPISYHKAALLQDRFVNEFLQWKKTLPPATSSAPAPFKSPPPKIITAQFNPVYTCGRREVGTVDAEQRAFLEDGGRAEFVEALRGGQTTFHGPGQVVAYPIIDIRQHGLTPARYVCALEQSVIDTLSWYGVKGFRTKDPGVWVSEEEKIASVGVHMRRNITSHGVAMNVDTDLWWFDRIVACGLVGKRATSLQKLGVTASFDDVEKLLVEKLAKKFGCEGVDVEDLQD